MKSVPRELPQDDFDRLSADEKIKYLDVMLAALNAAQPGSMPQSGRPSSERKTTNSSERGGADRTGR